MDAARTEDPAEQPEQGQLAEMRAEIAVLVAEAEALRIDNAALRAGREERDAQRAWRALKSCDLGPFSYECVRLWCVQRRITAEKRGGRWFADEASLSARLAMLAAFDR